MKKPVFIFIILTLYIFGSCSGQIESIPEPDIGVNTDSDETKTEAGEIYIFSPALLNCNFYDEYDFNLYVSGAESYDIDGEVLCGIVPHHLLAGSMIAGFFESAAKNRPEIETVVLLAPIHEPREDRLCTTLSNWSAPTGVLENETAFSHLFVEELNAVVSDNTAEQDHSVSSLIPFVKHYFPEAKTACLLIAPDTYKSAALSEKISELLVQLAQSKNCLFIFSVDFSHYLEPDQTYERDSETLKAVTEGDIESIFLMNNDNTDSPLCVSIFILLTEKLNGKIHELDHSNSMEILNYPYPHPVYNEGLTSYFIFAGIRTCF